MPTDTRSPLAAAVEALVDSCYWHSPTGKPELNDGGYVEVHPAHVTALRAALAADAAWRARAEAAIAWVEGHKACDAALRNYSPDSATYKGAVYRAEKAWDDARRRYEETCRG